jgi:trk system potassium uptake protein TrkA
MARFVVIGLGKFGGHVARRLYEKGHEVIGIDSDKERVQDLRDETTQAIVADSGDVATLRSLGVGEADAVVVSLGERMDASILTALFLREMGVKRIVAKAVSPDHGKILQLIANTTVVLPERDTAERVANALAAPSILEYLPLGVGFSLLEVAAPAAFVGGSLGDLQVRRRYEVLVVAVKSGERLELVPGADYVVQPGDVLVMIGRDENLEAVTRIVQAPD